MAPVVRWIKEQKGSITIQALLYIGVFVLILFMAFQVWKVVAIKQSLAGATYQASKYVALNGFKWILVGRKDILEVQVQQFIDLELHNNPFMPSNSHPRVQIRADVSYPDWCERSTYVLTVEVAYTFPVLHLGTDPSREQLTFRQVRGGQLRCYSH